MNYFITLLVNKLIYPIIINYLYLSAICSKSQLFINWLEGFFFLYYFFHIIKKFPNNGFSELIEQISTIISLNFIYTIIFTLLSFFFVPFFSSFLGKYIFYNLMILLNLKKIFHKGIIQIIIFFLPNFFSLIISNESNYINDWINGLMLFYGFLTVLENIKPNIIHYIIHNDIRDLIGFIFGPLLFSKTIINLISFDIIYFLSEN